MNLVSSRLRVALVASSLRLAGAEKQFAYMARALGEAGVNVRILHLGSGGHYEAALKQQGFPVLPFHVPGRPVLMLLKLIEALRAFRPHLVLASQFGDILHGAIAGRCTGALVLGGIRSNGTYELTSHGRRARWMLRLPHGLIANSHRAKETLVAAGVAPRKLAVLPNVIDLRDFDRRAAQPVPTPWPADRTLVAAVGSLQPGKRLDRFLEALALARMQDPRLFGVIVGQDRGVRTALEQQARSLGLLPAHVAFLGESNQVPALLTRVRALVLCSDFEGFPNVILEAMAAARPVIATPAGDASRIIQQGVTGFVALDSSPARIAEYLLQLARSPHLSAELGRAGRRRAEQEYDFGSLFRRLTRTVRAFAEQAQHRTLVRLLAEGWAEPETSAQPALPELSTSGAV